MKKFLLSRAVFFGFLILGGCGSGNQINSKQHEILESHWNQDFAECQREIVKNIKEFKSIGINTTSQREEFCSCRANTVIKAKKMAIETGQWGTSSWPYGTTPKWVFDKAASECRP